MDELLRYYEEELGVFGQFAREFRARYPKPAGDLHLSGETVDDPGVARLIQSVALLTARIRKRLDDDYPQFTEALLDSLYPHYLRPLPSHTIVQVGWRDDGEIAAAPNVLPRGTMLRASGNGSNGGAGGIDGVCRFRTCYDVLLAPFAVRRLSFAPLIEAPRALRLPRGVASCISIGIGSVPESAGFAQRLPVRLRLFVDGDPSLRAAFLDAVFLHCGGAWLQAGNGPWRPLARLPLRAAGFAEEDAMLPFPARSHPALRLLTEYFCYPDKFHFVDLDLDELRPCLGAGCTSFTLHLGLRGIPGDGDLAHLLAGLDPRNLLPGCTPAVNLFAKAGAPLLLTGLGTDHPLLADSAHAAAFEIYSVDAVRLVREGAAAQTVVPFAPLYEPMFGAAPDGAPQAAGTPAPHWWIARRDHATAAISPDHEMRIALLDREFAAVDAAGATLSTELTCSNRDLPARLPWGQAGGDLRADALSGTAPIRMLRKPSPGYRFENAHGAHWRLIAHLAPHPSSFCMEGLAPFQQMLALYDLPRSPAAQRVIAGIVGLEHGAERTWLPGAPVATLMPGIVIRLTIDDEAFAGSSVAVFAHVLDRYFALNAQLNCYTRLRVVSRQSGQLLLACAPRTGTAS